MFSFYDLILFAAPASGTLLAMFAVRAFYRRGKGLGDA
jgi:hypothetical protein